MCENDDIPDPSREGYTHVFTGATYKKPTGGHPQSKTPYSANPADLLANLSNFQLVDSSLIDWFSNSFFSTDTKIEIASMVSEFGCDYIEVESPVLSEQSRLDCEAICRLGLDSKILTRIQCNMEEAELAVNLGINGVDIVIESSQFMRQGPQGKVLNISQSAIDVIEYVKSRGVEVRFSTEDSFRCDIVDLLNIYRAVDKIGVDRVGIADTVGCANPRQVYDLVRTLRQVVKCDIECHFHNDTGCAIGNSYTALEAGATHIDVSVLGIGERNGITPLGGFIARMIAADRQYVVSKYNVPMLRDLEILVANAVQVNIPFNNPITGFCAFTHKAGIHAKAILASPSTYEILNPSDFGMTRYIHFANRLTGWNAIKSRVDQLNLRLTDDQCKDVTIKIKQMGDIRPLNIDDVDSLIKNYHAEVNEKKMKR